MRRRDNDKNAIEVTGIRAEDMDGFSNHKRPRRLVAIHAEGVWLTPVQARSIARSILRLAKWAEK